MAGREIVSGGWRHPNQVRAGAALAGLLAGVAALVPGAARAQYMPNYFPVGVPGFDQQLGVNVVTRLRPLYEQPGIHAGSFIIRPNLDESAGYNSNVFGLRGGPGSPVIETNPSVSINSDWGRNSLGASFSADNQRYTNTPSQNQTAWNAAIGGGYTIGRSDLHVAYGHFSENENATDIGAPPSTTPIPYTLDDFRANYTFDLGRLKITPNAEFSMYRYGTTTILGVQSNQAFRDADVFQGGAAFRYELSDQRALLLVLQGINSDFINPTPNSPSLSSTSGLVMGGIDYQYNGVWRYQLLGGLEVREFASSQFKTRIAPITKAAVIWTPTGLTTVTGTALRTLDDPSQQGTSGFTFTSAELRVDHEYRRNVLLNAETGVRLAEYQQNGGNQTQYYASAGVSWLINRNMRLTGQYTFTTQSSGGALTPLGGVTGVNTLVNSASYNQNLFLLTLHLGL